MGNRDKNFRQRQEFTDTFRNLLMRRGNSVQELGPQAGPPMTTTLPTPWSLDDNHAHGSKRQERSMRWMLVLVLLAGAALLAKPEPAPAQAAVSAYPWCLQKFASGRRNCYYSTYEQCLYDARPLGGVCIQSPYYGRPQPPGFAGPEALGPGAPYYQGPVARYSAEPTGAPPRHPAHRRHHHHS
jgi:hypothetical protein